MSLVFLWNLCRVVFGNDVVHPLNQIRTLKDNVSRPLLEVANLHELILKNGGVLLADMRVKPDSKIVAILRDGFAIQQIQHAIQIG